MLSTLDTSQFEMSLLNDVAPINMLFIEVTLDTSHVEMFPLKLDIENISVISATRETFHLEILPTNDVADVNMPLIDVTRDTTHLDKSPLNA